MSEICYNGNPVLRKKCEEVIDFDDTLADFAEELTEFMYEYDGIGLAAPQIGVTKRVAVIDVSNDGNKPTLFINPVITWKSEEIESDSEGCLSIPGIRGNVERPNSITVEAVDINGDKIVFEKITGLQARAFQHEMDHLDGVMFVDHLSPVKKTLIASKLKKLSRQNR
jgi:peptide deformylase